MIGRGGIPLLILISGFVGRKRKDGEIKIKIKIKKGEEKAREGVKKNPFAFPDLALSRFPLFWPALFGGQMGYAKQFFDGRDALSGFEEAIFEHGLHPAFLAQFEKFRRAGAADDRVMKPLIEDH